MEAIVVFLIVLVVIAFIGIGLLFLFELQYRNLINNESKLCLSGSCEATSTTCGSTPFKYKSDGSIACAPSSIFAGQIPNTNTSS